VLAIEDVRDWAHEPRYEDDPAEMDDGAKLANDPPRWLYDSSEAPLDLERTYPELGAYMPTVVFTTTHSFELSPLIIIVGHGDSERIVHCRWFPTQKDGWHIDQPYYMFGRSRANDDVDGIVVRLEEVRERVDPKAVRWYGYGHVQEKRWMEGLRALLLTCPAFGFRQAAEHIRYMPGGEGAEDAREDFAKRARRWS